MGDRLCRNDRVKIKILEFMSECTDTIQMAFAETMIEVLDSPLYDCNFCNDQTWDFGVDGYSCSQCSVGELTFPLGSVRTNIDRLFGLPLGLLVGIIISDKLTTLFDSLSRTGILELIIRQYRRPESFMRHFITYMISNGHRKARALGTMIALMIFRPRRLRVVLNILFLDDDGDLFQLAEQTEAWARSSPMYESLYDPNFVALISSLVREDLDQEERLELDLITTMGEEQMSRIAFDQSMITISASWNDIKRHPNCTKYRVMSELAKLKTFSEAEKSCCYRFARNASGLRVGQFVFVFAFNRTPSDLDLSDLKNLAKLVFRGSYQTIAECSRALRCGFRAEIELVMTMVKTNAICKFQESYRLPSGTWFHEAIMPVDQLDQLYVYT